LSDKQGSKWSGKWTSGSIHRLSSTRQYLSGRGKPGEKISGAQFRMLNDW
jgi:hypothetical protein